MRPWWWTWGLVLLGTDAALLTMHAVHLVLRHWRTEQNAVTNFLLNTAWNGSNDGSVVEIWGYVQLGTAALILMAMSLREAKRYAYTVWSLLFLVMTADDMLRWHEAFAESFKRNFWASPILGVPSYAFGQLLFWGALAIFLGGILMLAHMRSSAPTRRGSRQLLAGAVLLATVAVAVDLVSSLALEIWGPTTHAMFVYIEAVGELIFVTLILMIVLRIFAMQQGLSLPQRREWST